MSSEWELEAKEAFKMFDKNGNGEIEVHELREVIQCLGENPTQEEVEKMIKEYDLNNDGTINFEEFCKMTKNRCKSAEERKNELRMAFNMFDRNKDGKISADELRDVMTRMGEKLTADEVDEMIKTADRNEDGFIDYDEFVVMYTSD